MADPVVAAPTAADPKTTASNIVKGIQDRTNGKSTSAEPDKATVPVDPNAGKEKYVVDQKEIWLTPEQARAYTQKGIAFEPKVTQLGHLQREVNQLLNDLRDPNVALKKLKYTPKSVLEAALSSGEVGDDVKEFLGQWYWKNVVEPSKMTPEQREAMEARRKLEEYQSRDAAARDQAVKLENQRRVEMALSQISANIAEAMKESGLPSNDTPLGTFMARRVADIMRLGYFQKKAVTPKEAIEKVRGELKSIQTSWYDHLDEEALVKELGDKNAEKVKKYYLKLVKDAEKQKTVSTPSTPRKSGERKVITEDEFHDYLADLKKKG